MSDEILIATRKGLFSAEIVRGALRLGEPAFLGVPVSMALRDPRDGAVYAALDHGHFGVKLQKRVGAKWREIAVPALPQLPEGQVETDGVGRPLSRRLRLVFSLEIDPRTPGGLWCGTIPGGLFHSADGGASWRLVEALWNVPSRTRWFGGGFDAPGIHSILVDPRDPADVTVGISCGGVWRTRDGGASWANVAAGMRAAYMPKEQANDPDVQDPHRLARCAAVPDRLWCQHHNGIFRSGPGEGWREIKAKAPSRFGFACAAHPRDPAVAWFVPAQKDDCRVPVDGKVVLLRTTDGGKSFEVLTKGLPQRHAYDLVLRHALDVAADGRSLVFGSTSGRVWWSRDGGDGCRELEANLPPVAMVRWGTR